MGGGSSKEQTVTNQQMTKKGQQADPNAFDNYSGPAVKPNVSNDRSPIKSQSSKAQLSHQDDPEPDDQRPAAIAKQVRMSQQSSLGSPSPPHKTAKQIELEKQQKFQIELQKSQQQYRERQQQEQREREEAEMLRKKKEAEQEKIRQLQLLREQQKAQEAALKAQAVTTKAQSNEYLSPNSQGSEVFAEHYSPGIGMKKSQGYSDIISSQGTMGNINSPQKRAVVNGVNGRGQDPYGMDGIAVNGKGLQRDDSFQQIEHQQSFNKPQPLIQFKVINYNEEAQKQRDLSDLYGGDALGNYKNQESGIHIGIGMNNDDYNKDAEANRNIDMGELNQLLGI